MQDINLLPQSEIVERTKDRAVKSSTIISIFFLVCFIAATGYVLYLQKIDKDTIADLDSKIKSSRDQIIAKSDIEVIVRNLDKKYTALQNLFNNQKKYSLLITELRSRKPSTLEFTSVDLKDGIININGYADNYVSIAEFINSLLNTEFDGGIESLKSVFTSVSLNSVNMESSKDTIQFFIVVNFNSSLLK